MDKVALAKSNVVIKTARNIKRAYTADDAARGAYRKDVRLGLERQRLITESYKATEGEPMAIRRAKALEHILSNMTVYIRDWEIIVGNFSESPHHLPYAIEENWGSVHRLVNSEAGMTLLDDDGRKELDELCRYWKGRSISDLHQKYFSEEMMAAFKYEGTYLWSLWTEGAIPNFDKVLKLGLRGIIEQAKTQLGEVEKELPPDFSEKKDFLEAVVLSLEAAIKFACRYAALARELSEKESDEIRKKELTAIAEVCERVPEHPAETFHEALQSFYFIHMINRQIEYMGYGIGARFDILMNPYYTQDVKEGRITREGALELLKLLWFKFEECGRVYSPFLSGVYGGSQIVQALTIGGVDEDGKDVTNEMTYLVLDAVESARTLQGSLNLRYHDGTPKNLVFKAIDVLRAGIGYPAFLNDKVMVPLLLKWGLPLKDARNYAIRGCVYVNIPGKNMLRRAAGYLMLPKCLWWALHQGLDPKTGEQKGAKTKDPKAFTGVEDLLDAYLQQVRFFVAKQIRLENFSRTIFEKHLPRPFLSAVIDDSIERAEDIRKWTYPYQGIDNIIIIGPTNVADSLAAVKKFVFDEKKLTMAELIDILDRNWEGAEELRQEIRTRAPKYGNDDDYVDSLAKAVHHRTEDVIEAFTSNWGLKYVGDGSGVSGTYGLAFDTSATPDGRKDADPFADATLSPCPGADVRGPSAVLRSASKIDTLQTYQQLLNQKFQPQFLEGSNRELFYNYLKTWSDLGISHVQFNVVDRATLLDAQENPEKHTDLIVRVAGYSAYFVDLSKGLQDHIIARTEQSF